MRLVEKLCEVMAAIGWVEKTGYNENRRYRYATEADICAAVRDELSKRKVFVFHNVTNVTRTPHGSTKAGTPMFITDVTVEWMFMDAESGETHTSTIPGCGIDDQDKGLYKAITGSSKYFLMKSFFMPTGDDPEKDSKEDLEDARNRGKAAAQVEDARNRGKAAAQAVAADKIKELTEKAKQPKEPVKTPPVAKVLFFTYPPAHNGNYAEFVNISQYGASLDEVAQEGLRQIFKKYAKKITADNTALVSHDKMQDLLAVLAGECAITVQELPAK